MDRYGHTKDLDSDRLDVVRREFVVRGDERDAQHLRLRDQKPVEGIPMMVGKVGDRERVRVPDPEGLFHRLIR